jgi:amino acid adenylation domain-containing protein
VTPRAGGREARTSPGLVHELFRRRAAADPDRIAVRHRESAVTYGELAARADRLTAVLRGRGLGPEDIVGICLPRGAGLMVAVLGVLGAGAAYLPLDPVEPHRRSATTLRLAGTTVVLTTRDRTEAFRADGADVLDLDDLPHPGGVDLPPAAPAPHHLAYVVFTSGSTGAPKGVMIEHGALASFVAEEHARLGVGPGDRVAMAASPGFDASVFETWVPLTAGAEVHVADAGTVLSPEDLRDWLVGRRITVVFLTTSLAVPLLRSPWPGDCALRLLLVGGERLPGRPDPGLPFTLVNNYGPTETTVFATAGEITADGDGPPPIGRPLADAEIRVLDEHLGTVPDGVAGELFIGGPGLARGYIGRPELTAERFVRAPDGERLYRTGDLGRVRTDGALDFLGRADDQVKIRGHRVEPDEVRIAVERHPDVASAHVAARGEADVHLVGYVVPRDPDRPPSAVQLRAFLADFLPAYLVPRHFVAMLVLPLTGNGKLDRAALPAPEAGGAPSAYAPPSSAVQARLVALWQQVLGVDRVGLDDSFFDLGGHSLLLTQVHRYITRELGHALALVELFEYPTVRALSARLESGPPDEALADPPDDASARRRSSGRLRSQRVRARRDESLERGQR